MKHLKMLGFVAVGVMALTAVFGAASASAVKFTAGKVGASFEETTLSQGVFSVTGSEVKCNNVTFEGVTEGLETTEASGMGTASECTAFGFSASVVIENCKGIVYADGKAASRRTNTAGAKCVGRITVKNVFAECELVGGEQEVASAASFTNGEGDVKVKANGSANIAVEVTKSSGLCPLTVGKHTNAHVSGESTVKASGTTISWDA